MLFKLLYWCWINAVAVPLWQFGSRGETIHNLLFPVFVKYPGLVLAFISYLIYPPVVIMDSAGGKLKPEG